jgi:hypothetical protein
LPFCCRQESLFPFLSYINILPPKGREVNEKPLPPVSFQALLRPAESPSKQKTHNQDRQPQEAESAQQNLSPAIRKKSQLREDKEILKNL